MGLSVCYFHWQNMVWLVVMGKWVRSIGVLPKCAQKSTMTTMVEASKEEVRRRGGYGRSKRVNTIWQDNLEPKSLAIQAYL